MSVDWRDLLERVLEGETLSDDKARALSEALDDDANRREAAESLRFGALVASEFPDDSNASRERLLAKVVLADHAVRSRRRVLFWRGTLAAAAAVLVAAGAWLYFRSGYPEPQFAGDFRVAENRVVAGPKGAQVNLGGYCDLTLDPGTEIVLGGTSGHESIDIEQGTVLSKITPNRGGFAVQTPLGTLTVLGTEFTTTVRPGNEAMKEEPPATPAKVWITILPLSPIRSLDDYVEAWRAHALQKGKLDVKTVELEIRSAKDMKRVAVVRNLLSLPEDLADPKRFPDGCGGNGLNPSPKREVGKLPDGDYLVAVNVDGIRCSNVALLRIDSMFDPKKAPTIEIIPLPLGFGRRLPYVGVVGTGTDPIDPKLTNDAASFPTLIVDDIERKLDTITWVGPVGPLPPGQRQLVLQDLTRYKPEIDPGVKHRVKARVFQYESAEVTIPTEDTLGPKWDAKLQADGDQPGVGAALPSVVRWAEARGWKAAPIVRTTLESTWGGWRNLPFDITREESADLRTCLDTARNHGTTINDKNQFYDDDGTREALEKVLASRPGYFYAEYLLSQWHRRNGNMREADDLLEQAYKHAPVIIVQPYADAKGTPLADAGIQSFALECNRVKQGNLDPSIELKYFDLVTDASGCIYFPAYNTVFRTNNMSRPEHYDANYPRLGWFQASTRVGQLPVCVVEDKAAAPPAAAPAAAELPWGEAVEGVQMRLRADKAQWKVGETPSFLADFKQTGKRILRLVSDVANWEIELDGAWHRATAWRTGIVPERALGADSLQTDIRFTTEEWAKWKSKDGNRPLEFPLGKHTVRIAFRADSAAGIEGIPVPPVRVVSNPVEIEIVPGKEAARFAIYLVEKPEDIREVEQTPLDKLVLSDKPLLTQDDVERYDWRTQTIRFKPGFKLVLPASRVPTILGFVVVAGGERCYVGAFVAQISSYAPPLPIGSFGYDVPTFGRDQMLSPAKMSISSGRGADPRGDERIRKALAAAGKLDGDFAPLTPEQRTRAEALITQLGDVQFAVREQAVKELVTMGPAVLPLVRKTLDETLDAEVKLRCQTVIKKLGDTPPPVVPKPAENVAPTAPADREPPRRTVVVGVSVKKGVVAYDFDGETGKLGVGEARTFTEHESPPGPRIIDERPVFGTAEPSHEPAAEPAVQPVLPPGAPKLAKFDKDGTLRLYDFDEGADTDGWGTAAVEMTLSDQHATSGKQSLKVVFQKNGFYGGFAPWVPRDWSGYESLKLDVWAEEDGTLCFRADDENSQGYDTRFNLDDLKLHKGANTVVIPVSDVSARIDVTKVVFFSVFTDGVAMPGDTVVYLDSVRLVKEEPVDAEGPIAPLKTRNLPWAKKDPQGALVLYDFEKPEELAGWQRHRSAATEASRLNPATGRASLKVTLKAGTGATPEVDPVTPEDWSEYHTLEFDIWCEGAMDMAVRVTDPKSTSANRRYYEENLQLRDGPNTVTLSLDAAGVKIDIEHVKQLLIYRRNVAKDSVFYLDDLRLTE